MAAKRSKSVPASGDRPVKTTLSLDVDLHARLKAKAARRRMGISALAVEYIQAGLRGFVVIDRSGDSDRGKSGDRPSAGLSISPDVDEDAA